MKDDLIFQTVRDFDNELLHAPLGTLERIVLAAFITATFLAGAYLVAAYILGAQ